MRTGFIISGIVFIIVAILVIFADNVNVFGLIVITNVLLRIIITVILGLLGVILIVVGARKARINR